MRRIVAAVVALSSWNLACGGDDPPPAATASWVAGDFHVHSSAGSNDTRYPDGSLRSAPETIRDVARERGLGFVVITDHSNSTGSDPSTQVEDPDLWNRGPEFPLWDEAAGLSTPEIIVVNGNEVSPVAMLDASLCPDCPTLGSERPLPVGHVGCIPESLDGFTREGPFVDRPPAAVPGGRAVRDCQARGGFAIINHAFARATPLLEYDWTDLGYDAIEVYNGSVGWDGFDRTAYDAYLCDRLLGRDVVAVGGSDSHRAPVPYDEPIGVQLGPPIALPATSVWSGSRAWDEIMTAVRAGRIVVHELGTFVEVVAVDAAEQRLGGVGDRIGPGAAALVLRGTSPRPQMARLFHVAEGACDDRRIAGRNLAPVVVVTEVATIEVCATGACDFEHVVAGAPQPGLWFATVGTFDTRAIGIRDVAVTNVLTIDDD